MIVGKCDEEAVSKQTEGRRESLPVVRGALLGWNVHRDMVATAPPQPICIFAFAISYGIDDFCRKSDQFDLCRLASFTMAKKGGNVFNR